MISRLQSKLERAEEHLRALRTRWAAFQENAYPVTFKDDTNSGCRIYTLQYAMPVPEDISWMVGDAAHNLISALDHVAYRLVFVHTGGSGPFTNVYFPVAKTVKHFGCKLTRTSEHEASGGRVIQRLNQKAIKAIQAIEPYEGGKGEVLSHVHQLDIIDKHHMLLTVGSMNRLQTMPPSEIAYYRKTFLDSGLDDDLTPEFTSRAFLAEAIRVKFPLKTGDELARVPFAEVDENMYFAFEVAFGEPEVLKGKPIIVTLYRADQLIRNIIRDFDGRGFFA